MQPLRLDSAPAVDLRRSTKLPMEVLENIHAFLPRDSLAKSPMAEIVADMIEAHGPVFYFRVRCPLCRRRVICRTFYMAHGFVRPREHRCVNCMQTVRLGFRPRAEWHRRSKRRDYYRNVNDLWSDTFRADSFWGFFRLTQYYRDVERNIVHPSVRLLNEWNIREDKTESRVGGFYENHYDE